MEKQDPKADGNGRKPNPQMQANLQEELVATSASQRNWRGIVIALLVIIVVCALIVTAVVILTPKSEGPRVRGDRLVLTDVLSDYLRVDEFNGTWISDYEFLYRDKDGALMLYNANNRSATVFLTNSSFRQVNAQDWSLSPDKQYLLLTHEVFKVFRHSHQSKYSIYELKTGQLYRLSPTEGKHPKLQYAAWGPRRNTLVFVHDNDIYYKTSAVSEKTIRITNTGLEGTIWNGVPDWVYEEEILSSDNAIWFSDDGKMLCFASFNDSQVPVMSYVWYGNYDDRYSTIASIRYPKPSTQNPTVDITVLDLDTLESPAPSYSVLTPPAIFATQDHYFTAVKWVDNTQISVIWMNRQQNVSLVTFCWGPLWYCNESHRVDTEGLGWVNLYSPPLMSKDAKKYFLIIPAKDGAFGYYPQVAVKHIAENRLNILTHGRWEVTSIEHYDEKDKAVYYIAAPEGKPGQRHLYRVTENDTNVHKLGECLTCNISEDCLYMRTKFSKGGSYFILECLGPGVPTHYLVHSRQNNIVAVINNHTEVKEILAQKALPQVRTFRVPLEHGFDAHVKLFLPPGLRDDEIIRYPLVVQVYGGPGSQMVSEKYKIGWEHYLSSNRDMIYAFIDGRGSGYQGNQLMFQIYRKFGTVEVEDQRAVAEYLKDNLHFVDPDKIAIWGWSYGGYVTAMALGTDSGIFKCGISVAPVVNWLYYDSVYTERYMGTPEPTDNVLGYERSDILKIASNFKNKNFFLIHGTADDNVHFHQAMMLTKALIRAGVNFRSQLITQQNINIGCCPLYCPTATRKPPDIRRIGGGCCGNRSFRFILGEMVYPDEPHALSGVTHHLYESMEDFLDNCFHSDKKSESVEKAQEE